MHEPIETTLVGLEFLVPRIDDALAVFVDVLGFTLADRGPAPGIAAERAILATGDVAITLIEAHDSGSDQVIVDRTPRLTQLVVSAAPAGAASSTAQLGRLGLPTEDLPNGGAFVAPEAMAGVIGTSTALVVLGQARADGVES